MFNRSANRGFTLIEIMVVVVILGILAGIVVPRIMDRPDDARMAKARQDIRSIEQALQLYRMDNYVYPTTDQGLEALVSEPSGSPNPPNWRQYMDRIPNDPWGREYQYVQPGEHGDFDIYSLGADGREGGEGANAVIGNWNID
ncbi:general secretion pathway protein G [Natronospira proteinivora]|uniref:Type II secretion system core protein G n=1 Tax=Natronospira proteinivora TaxID=1807133 RepID=A0ABT1G6J2_9GAMM|nr:type II secretion system major pseudopilin GspG [Natronospira proteinivora]MCP1726871.1 general secretion pathway protein G [Natronospira proteinivora]